MAAVVEREADPTVSSEIFGIEVTDDVDAVADATVDGAYEAICSNIGMKIVVPIEAVVEFAGLQKEGRGLLLSGAERRLHQAGVADDVKTVFVV